VILWGLAALALVVALAAMVHARRLARRLDALNQAYWELRYDYTRLRSQLSRLDPELADQAEDAPANGPGAGQAAPSVSFVPLSSLKKKEP
jgi:hypothetical protein